MSVRLSDRSGRAGPVAGKGFCKHKSERCDTSVSPSHRMDRHPADLSPETIHSGSRSSPDSGPFSKCLSSPVSSFSQQVTSSHNPYKPPSVTHVAVQFVLSCFDLSSLSFATGQNALDRGMPGNCKEASYLYLRAGSGAWLGSSPGRGRLARPQ